MISSSPSSLKSAMAAETCVVPMSSAAIMVSSAIGLPLLVTRTQHAFAASEVEFTQCCDPVLFLQQVEHHHHVLYHVSVDAGTDSNRESIVHRIQHYFVRVLVLLNDAILAEEPVELGAIELDLAQLREEVHDESRQLNPEVHRREAQPRN